MYRVKQKTKKNLPDNIFYLFAIGFTCTGVALFAVLITYNLFFICALIGSLVTIIVIYYMTDDYKIISVQESFREDGSLDVSLYLVHMAEIEYAKFGKYNKKNVDLRIRILERDMKGESDPKKKRDILKELKQICIFFGFDRSHKHYDKRLKQLEGDIKAHEEKIKADDNEEEQKDPIEANLDRLEEGIRRMT